MINLDLNISMDVRITEELDYRLQMGEPAAFLELEIALKNALTGMTSHAEGGFFQVGRLEIQDAGPHNVIYDQYHPSSGDRNGDLDDHRE